MSVWVIATLASWIPGIALLYYASPGSSLFSWHPTCMSISFIITFTTAAHVLRKNAQPTWSTPRQRGTSGLIHASAMGAALLLTIAGFAVMYQNKKVHNKEHFTSWHGKFGLATFVVTLFQALILGLPSYFTSIRPSTVPLLQLRKVHAGSAVLFSILAATTLLLGFQTSWFQKQITGSFEDNLSSAALTTYKIVTALFSIIVLLCYLLTITQVFLRYPQLAIFQGPVKLLSYLNCCKRKPGLHDSTKNTHIDNVEAPSNATEIEQVSTVSHHLEADSKALV